MSKKKKKRIKNILKTLRRNAALIWPLIVGTGIIVALISDSANSLTILKKIFEKEITFSNDSHLKILIAPLNQLCKDGENKGLDIGQLIQLRLTNIFEVDKRIKLETIYLENYNGKVDASNSKALKNRHKADIIIFGNQISKYCNPNSTEEFCLNYIITKSWNTDKLETSNNLFTEFDTHQFLDGNIYGDINNIVQYFYARVLINKGYSEEGMEILLSLNDDGFEDSKMYDQIVHHFMKLNDFREFEEYSTKQKKYYDDRGLADEIIRNRINYYYHKSSFTGFSEDEIILKLLELEDEISSYEVSVQSDLKKALYRSVGDLYGKNENLDKAHKYFEKSLSYVNTFDDLVYLNIFRSVKYAALGNCIKGKRIVQESYRSDSIKNYSKLDVIKLKERIYRTSAHVYRLCQNNREAISFYEKIISLAKKEESVRNIEIPNSYHWLSEIYRKEKNKKKELEYLLKIIDFQIKTEIGNHNDFLIRGIRAGRIYDSSSRQEERNFLLENVYDLIKKKNAEIDPNWEIEILYDLSDTAIKLKLNKNICLDYLSKAIQIAKKNSISFESIESKYLRIRNSR